MNQRTFIVTIAVLLTVMLPYWIALPVLSDFVLAQALAGAFIYILEVVLIMVLVMAAIEGRMRLLIGAAVVGLLLGAVPGASLLPVSLYLPLWLKAVGPALVLGVLISRGQHAGRAFAIASICTAAFVLLMFVQVSSGLMTQVGQINDSIEKMIAGPMTARGYDSEAIAGLVDQMIIFTNIVVRLLPGLLIMSGIGQLFVAFLIIEWYFTRRDSYFPGFGPFIYWKMPEKLLYLLGTLLLVRLTVGGGLRVAADNAIFILFTCYAVCGLSMIEHLLRRLRLPVFVRAIFYIGLLFMHVPGLVLTSIAGLFDSYFDFRKVRAHTLG